MASSPAPASPRGDVAPAEGAPQLAALPHPPPATVEAARMASIASSLVGAAASLRSLAAAHPALVASGELLAALGDVTAAVTAMSHVNRTVHVWQ